MLGRASTVASPAVASASINPTTETSGEVREPYNAAACPSGKTVPTKASPTMRPTRKPKVPSPRVLNASQLMPRDSLTLRCTSAICTSRFTC